MRTFFTSDLHLNHRNILQYCNRPWQTVEEMNEALIDSWNERVKGEDRVYVVGDFSLTHRVSLLEGWLQRLNGEKILIRGNHDNKKALKHLTGWSGVYDLLDTEADGAKIRLCHYRLLDWRGPRILLHGHSHSQAPKTAESCYDVGVDANNYRPVTLEELLNERAV